MSNNSLYSFMKTSEYYFRFTERNRSSFDFNNIAPFISSKAPGATNHEKNVNNKNSS